MMDGFDARKAQVLAGLQSDTPDKSPKGGLDAPCAALVQWLNAQRDICTTSSCSGRVSLFAHAPGRAKGGRWAYISHERASADEVAAAFAQTLSESWSAASAEQAPPGDVVLRFEPFILTAECRTRDAGLQLVATALAAGFRESGVVAAARRVIVTLRCSIRLEVPVARGGVALLPSASLVALVGIANEKFDANAARAAALFDALRRAAGEPPTDVADAGPSPASGLKTNSAGPACAACGRKGRGGAPERCSSTTVGAPFKLLSAAQSYDNAHASRAAVLAATQQLLLLRLSAAERLVRSAASTSAAASLSSAETSVPAACRAVAVPRAAAARCKDELRRRGWLDERLAPRADPSAEGVIFFPLSPATPGDDGAVASALRAAFGALGAPTLRPRCGFEAVRKAPRQRPLRSGRDARPPPGAEDAALDAPGARWLALRHAPGCGAGVLACDVAVLGAARLGCPAERARLAAACRPGDVVYDLQARTGAYLIAAAHGGGAAAVWGCETKAALLAAARTSLRLSGGPAACDIAARLRHADGRVPGALPPGGADRVLVPWTAGEDNNDNDTWIAAAAAALRRRRGGVMHLHCSALAAGAAASTDAFSALAEATATRARRCLPAWTVRALGAWPLAAPPGGAVVYVACEPAVGVENGAGGSGVGLNLHERPPAKPLPRVPCPDRAALLAAVLPRRQPAILTGVPMGRCVRAWSAATLANAAPTGGADVAVHVTPSRTVDLAGHRAANTRRNFAFKNMPFAEAVRRCAGPEDDLHVGRSVGEPPLQPLMAPGERLYLRSVGSGREASHLPALFPSLAADVALFSDEGAGGDDGASSGGLFDRDSYHSSVLRLSSPDTALWAHYDVMDNVLMQVVGSKRVTLFPPAAAPHLYVEGSSSRVPDLDAPLPQLAAAWPAALAALPLRLEGELRPGEALYIPALWFHAVTSGRGRLSAAVNVFFRDLPAASYDGADPFGNRDLPAGVRAAEAAAVAARGLAQLPPRYRAFYARRAAKALIDAADEAQAEDDEAEVVK